MSTLASHKLDHRQQMSQKHHNKCPCLSQEHTVAPLFPSRTVFVQKTKVCAMFSFLQMTELLADKLLNSSWPRVRSWRVHEWGGNTMSSTLWVETRSGSFQDRVDGSSYCPFWVVLQGLVNYQTTVQYWWIVFQHVLKRFACSMVVAFRFQMFLRIDTVIIWETYFLNLRRSLPHNLSPAQSKDTQHKNCIHNAASAKMVVFYFRLTVYVKRVQDIFLPRATPRQKWTMQGLLWNAWTLI